MIRRFAKECEVVRNGVDLDEFKMKVRKDTETKTLLFVGNFSYFPNVDAINYFYHSVFINLPRDIKLKIIGKKVNTLTFLKDERIEAHDYIPKIQDAYKDVDITISPVRLGGGTNFKILESMAAGVPVVALPDRLEGLDVSNGENIMVAKDEAQFSDAINKLLSDYQLRKKIALNARKLVEREYSWKVIGNNLNTIWNNL
jgi:glycosyltransferase involved in cell wall biosynthesis